MQRNDERTNLGSLCVHGFAFEVFRCFGFLDLGQRRRIHRRGAARGRLQGTHTPSSVPLTTGETRAAAVATLHRDVTIIAGHGIGPSVNPLLHPHIHRGVVIVTMIVVVIGRCRFFPWLVWVGSCGHRWMRYGCHHSPPRCTTARVEM